MYCLQGQNGNGKSRPAYFRQKGASFRGYTSDQADGMKDSLPFAGLLYLSRSAGARCRFMIMLPVRPQIRAVGSIKGPLAGREIWALLLAMIRKLISRRPG